MNNVTKGRDVATDINVTIFKSSDNQSYANISSSNLLRLPVYAKQHHSQIFRMAASTETVRTQKGNWEWFCFVVVVVVAFLHNIFSQYRGQCNRKPFYVSFIKSLKGIMLNGWILFSSKKALKWAGLSKYVLDYKQSLFFCSLSSKTRDTQMAARVTDGAKRERLLPSFARLAASLLPCACIALTRSEEKERLFAV